MIDMSDSETDLLPSNVLTFQNQGTTVCAKGPNISSTNISSLNFRSNTMSSMNMLWNMDRPRYAESICDPRNMSYRREREVSPMSCRSASGLHPRNFHHSYYPGGPGSHRSMYNGRSGSPMSVKSSRTIDSNTSMSARDIAFAFQNGHFNKFDFKIIKEAYNKYMKCRLRRRVEKKKNIKMFLKGFRRQSGGDSGDQASNSSISSDDDCRSLRSSKSTISKNIIPRCRSTITDMSHFRRAMRENDMVKDSTDNFRQNSFKNMFPLGPQCVKDTTQPRWQNNSVQKDRFKGNFLLPSQRFDQSVASSLTDRPSRLASICEDNMVETTSSRPRQINRQENRKSNETDSEQDEIFGEVTIMEKNNNGKRSLEEGVPASESKRTKLSPQRNSTKPKTPKPNQLNTKKQKANDFVFAKPQLPLKKLGLVKNTQKNVTKGPRSQNIATSRKSVENKDSDVLTSIQSTEKIVPKTMTHSEEKLLSSSQKAEEKLIAKSTQVLEPEQSVSRLPTVDEQEKELCPRAESTQFSTTDMSMRPSFIKRKLFTQKVDETTKNSSSDSLQADSPQTNIYSKIQKEKNKARKLATQSYLNRDFGDESNLLDLIHKIVPPDRMNVTTTNRSELPNNKSKPNNKNDDNADKWDITSIISTCNNEDVSDTYTDEEIFSEDEKENQEESKVTKQIRDNQNKTKGKETKKDKVKEQKDAAVECDTSSLTEKQNKIVENKQSNPVKVKKSKRVDEKLSKHTVRKHSKNKDEKQIMHKTEKQNVIEVEKLDKEEQTFKSSKDASENQDILTEKQTKTLREKQIKTTTVKNNVAFKKQNMSVVLKQNTAGKQDKPEVEKQSKVVVDKKSAAPEKHNNTTLSKTTPPKFLVVLQKLTPQVINELSPTDRDGLVKANVYKGVKSFWDTDTESEFEATPIKRTGQVGQLDSRPLGDHTMVDTVIQDISSVPQLIKSSSQKKLNVTLKKLQVQGLENKKKAASVTQKQIQNTEHTNKQSSNKKQGGNNGRGSLKVPPISANERMSPVKNRINKTASSTKENQPPTKKTSNEKKTTPKLKQKINTNQTADNQSRMNDSLVRECRHVKLQNNTLRIRSQRQLKESCYCKEPDSMGPSGNDSSLYRSLRSRQVDLSISLKSDDNIATLTTTTAKKNKGVTKIISKDKGDNTLPSDISFTLTSDPAAANRTLRNRRTTANTQATNRRSDVSFTLVSDKKSMNDSVSLRTSKRRREIESLQNNSESFFKTRKRSPLSKRITPENFAANRSRSRRLL